MAIYNSVTDLIDDVFDDPEMSKRVEAKRNETRLIDELVMQRIKSGKSQADVANDLNCSASKVSRFEDKKDRDVKLGELVDYCSSLGVGVGISVASPVHNRAEALTSCVAQMNNHLNELSKLARDCDDDKSIVEGITKFQAEVLLKIMTNTALHCNEIVKRIDYITPSEKQEQLQEDCECRELVEAK